jgi:hypothetical protein
VPAIAYRVRIDALTEAEPQTLIIGGEVRAA